MVGGSDRRTLGDAADLPYPRVGVSPRRKPLLGAAATSVKEMGVASKGSTKEVLSLISEFSRTDCYLTYEGPKTKNASDSSNAIPKHR